MKLDLNRRGFLAGAAAMGVLTPRMALAQGVNIDIGTMGVDNQAIIFDVMTGNMQISNLLQGQGLKIVERIKIEVLTVHIDVIHIEMKKAAGSIYHSRDKLRF